MSHSIALYYPLVILLLGYAVLTIAGRIFEGRPDSGEAGAGLQTFGFALMLVAAVYVLGLAVFSIITFPVTLFDFAVILVTIFLFFGILLGALRVFTEVRVGGTPLGAYVLGLLLIALGALIVI